MITLCKIWLSNAGENVYILNQLLETNKRHYLSVRSIVPDSIKQQETRVSMTNYVTTSTEKIQHYNIVTTYGYRKNTHTENTTNRESRALFLLNPHIERFGSEIKHRNGVSWDMLCSK